MTKTIAIVGATGLQGGSVVKALYGTGEYSIRALTRNPESASSKALKEKYPKIELVQTDIDNFDSLCKAFKGADVVFGMTQFFQKEIMAKIEAGDLDAEFNQGKAIVDAAIAEGVSSLIYSSLDSMKKNSNGKYPGVLHFEGKHRVQEYLLSKSDKIRGYIVYVGFYMENYIDFARISQADNSTIEFSFPLDATAQVPLVDTANDVGGVVKYVLDNPEECLGKVVEVSGGYYEAQEMVKAFIEVTGKSARYVQIPCEYLNSDELTQMFKGIQEFGLFGGRTDFIDRNKRIDHKFTTPVEFWKNRGWTGPSQ
ncbi:hypothetical protein GGI07_001790 [Coemansia sp. Benny D115]|nr:hypothetical protein GGI07_001790 [Coemansia sp. Benny D115]